MLPQADIDINDGIQFDFELERQPSKTFRIDFDNKRISGEIDGVDSVKQSVFLACRVERYNWIIYNWNYGIEIEDVFGENPYYVTSELQRRFTEAIEQDDRVTDVYDFKFEVVSNSVYMEFVVESIHGSFTHSMEVKMW